MRRVLGSLVNGSFIGQLHAKEEKKSSTSSKTNNSIPSSSKKNQHRQLHSKDKENSSTSANTTNSISSCSKRKHLNQQSQRPSKKPKDVILIKGLENIGNSCYMNSCLQLLGNLIGSELCQLDACHFTSEDSCHRDIVRMLHVVLSRIQSPDCNVSRLSLIDMRQALFQHPTIFGDLQGEMDPMEALSAIVNSIYSTCHQGTPLHQRLNLDMYVVDSDMRCNKCGNSHIVSETNSFLMVAPQDGLKENIRREFNDVGEPSWCELCQSNTLHSKDASFQVLPKKLVINYKLFNATQDADGNFVLAKQYNHTSLERFLELDGDSAPRRYEICGIVLHHGTNRTKGGHVTCIKRIGGRWYHFDDDKPVASLGGWKGLMHYLEVGRMPLYDAHHTFSQNVYIVSYVETKHGLPRSDAIPGVIGGNSNGRKPVELYSKPSSSVGGNGDPVGGIAGPERRLIDQEGDGTTVSLLAQPSNVNYDSKDPANLDKPELHPMQLRSQGVASQRPGGFMIKPEQELRNDGISVAVDKTGNSCLPCACWMVLRKLGSELSLDDVLRGMPPCDESGYRNIQTARSFLKKRAFEVVKLPYATRNIEKIFQHSSGNYLLEIRYWKKGQATNTKPPPEQMHFAAWLAGDRLLLDSEPDCDTLKIDDDDVSCHRVINRMFSVKWPGASQFEVLSTHIIFKRGEKMPSRLFENTFRNRKHRCRKLKNSAKRVQGEQTMVKMNEMCVVARTRVCNSCGEDKTQESYSTKQWRKGKTEGGRCKICITAVSFSK